MPDELMKIIMKMVNEEMNSNVNQAKFEEIQKKMASKGAENIAEINKKMYDAHIKVGFSKEEALQLVCAMSGKMSK